MATDRKKVEEVNTDVSFEALITLFRDRTKDALDSNTDQKPKHTCENIRDVCDNILEDDDG